MKWSRILLEESKKEYFKSIQTKVAEDSEKFEIYPPMKDIFNAFKVCPFEDTKVVILGQDCYHGPGQAHGLSFSVLPGVPLPPSLRNIFKELKSDIGFTIPKNGCLTGWARQGILLLNTTLTVRRGEPASHADFGWQLFTNQILTYLNEKETPVVFILWGGHARKKKTFISNPQHLILESGHPSPLSCKLFFGNKHFSQCNQFLTETGQVAIDWNITNSSSV